MYVSIEQINGKNSMTQSYLIFHGIAVCKIGYPSLDLFRSTTHQNSHNELLSYFDRKAKNCLISDRKGH